MNQTKKHTTGKKLLALLLALIMSVGLLPMSVFAADLGTEAPIVEGQTQQDVQQDAALDESSGEEDAAPMDEGEEDADADDADADAADDGIAAFAAAGVAVQATLGTKPADGTTTGQPFASGTGGSTYFRIPALVTLSNGTLVAAADARWTTTGDGGGLDTIVSRSSDNGERWNYTFANYLGDNGNTYNGSSTAFIDPALAVDGDTIYMLVDLFPYGRALNSADAQPVSFIGFNANGKLRLALASAVDTVSKRNKEDNYTYYLDGNTIYNAKGTAVSGYTVDEYFNVYQGTTYVGNLFIDDSPYKVVPTGYLYLTKSTDKGETWSAPQLLNVKKSTETVCLVGPGRGLVTSDGTIIFPVYGWSGSASSQRTGFVYSTDGVNWSRSDGMSTQSSEGAVVELSAGKLRMFYRNPNSRICYVDITKGNSGYTWGSPVTTSIANRSDCQLSAITYSKKINGEQVIIVSCPSSTGSRTNGKLYLFKASDMTLLKQYQVNYSTYQYSCLTELSDGRIGLLYENGSASITYTSFDPEEKFGVTFDAVVTPSVPVEDKKTGVTVKFDNSAVTSMTVETATVAALGDTDYVAYNVTPGNGYDKTGATVTLPLSDALKSCDANRLYGFYIENNKVVKATDGERNADGTYTFTVPHFSVVGVAVQADTTGETVTKDITVYVGGTNTGTYNIGGFGKKDDASNPYYNVSYEPVEIPGKSGYQPVTSITSDESYYISDGTNYLTLTSTSSGRWPNYSLTNTTDSNAATKWTFEAQSGGGYRIKDANTGRYLIYSNGLSTSSASYVRYYTSTWYVDANGGIYCSVTSRGTTYTYYLTPGASWSASMTPNTDAKVYSTTPVSEPDRTDTMITFTGKVPTPEGQPEVFKLGTGTFYVTVKEDPGYVTPGKTPFVGGNNTFYDSGKSLIITSASTSEEITKLTISAGQSYDVNLNITGSNITWAVADETIATVDETGKVTAIKAGDTELIVTVDGVSSKMPISVKEYLSTASASSVKVYDLYISEITDSTVYYGVLYGTSNSNVTASALTEVQQGEVVYLAFPSDAGTAVDFFASPDEGFALTQMSATNAAGDYMALNATTAASTDFITATGKAGAIQVDNYGTEPIYALVNAALNTQPKCDGGLGFTRTSNDKTCPTSKLTFRSEKLPTVTKEVVSVNGVAYTEGMVGKKGDVIRFKITVTKYACSDANNTITYSGVTLNDVLTVLGTKRSNAYFENSTSGTKSISIANGTAAETTDYYVTYTVTDQDLERELLNTVTLNYTYKSTYSSGSFTASAAAEAKLIITDFVCPKDIVIDFGLPVVITTASWAMNVEPYEATGSAEYGNVDVKGTNRTGLTITYTPNTMNRVKDKITLKSERGLEFSFYVIPASTVYYEDSFVKFYGSDGAEQDSFQKTTSDDEMGKWYWDGKSANDAPAQALEALGGKSNVYGYDPAYNTNSTTFSMGSAKKVTVDASVTKAPTATFTFKGTGFDIISLTDNNSGAIVVDVVGKNSSYNESLLVNSYYGYVYNEETGEWKIDNTAQDNALYQIPVMKVTGLDYDEYTVTINVGYGKFFDKTGDSQYSFWLDAIRVYDPMGKDYADYTKDQEGYPQYIKLRDELAKDVASVNDKLLFIDGAANAEVDLYKNYGPNNEVYLAGGQAISFKLTGDLGKIATIQVGAKKPSGTGAVMTVNETEVSVDNSATEMYYTITCNTNDCVTITNTGADILSLTNLKVTFTSAGTVSLTKTSTQEQANAVAAVRALFTAPEPDPEPVVFAPEYFQATWNRGTVKVGQKATLTVKTSADVESVTVNGQDIGNYRVRTERTGWGWNAKKVTYHVFTFTVTATEAGTLDYSVIAANAEGVNSEAITATLTVQAAAQRPGFGGWLDKIFSRWF